VLVLFIFHESLYFFVFNSPLDHFICFYQHKDILERPLPDSIKLNIAKRIENNLYSKVVYIKQYLLSLLFHSMMSFWLQVPFLSSMHGVGNIRTLFSAEVFQSCSKVSWALCV
jgi:hypothetical protein